VRRRLTALVVSTGLVACASASPPPGGAEDLNPPRLLGVTPDSNAVNVRDRNVVFQFDETINDRGSGAQEIDNYFLVSPSDGNPRVSWRRSRIEVRPREGFRENTAYTVTLLPGLSDLRGNATRAGASVVFSTGPAIPPHRITGTAFDWVAERPATRALIQAVTADSIMYLAQSDSVGRFTVGPLPPGSYLVRAIADANGNRALDRNEAFDTARVVAPQAAPIELLVAPRDTLPARIASVAVVDSTSLRVTFDRFLDPDQPPTATAFRLVAADSAPVPVLEALSPRAEQAATRTRDQARLDSLRRADSLAGRPLAPRAATPPVRAPAAGATPSAPAPYTTLLLRLGRPLAPAATYRLSVSSARGLSGREQGSERSFTTPRAPAPAPADTSRRTIPSRPPATSTPTPPLR
jgi:hypothetical protein